MAQQELFGRVIEIIVGIQGSEGFRVLAEPAVLTDLPALRVDFLSEYKTDGKPNKAKISIFNPPDRMISDLLRGEEAFISISAGYTERFGLVFAGRPTRDGITVGMVGSGDVKLQIMAMAGGPTYRQAAAKMALPGRRRARDVAEQLAQDGGWTVGKNEIDPNIVYPRGFYASGDAPEVLREVARYGQVEILISGTEMSFLNPTRINDTQEVVAVFSSRPDKANLIGNVARTDKGRLKFKGLLEPELRPGDQVVLEFYDLKQAGWVKERVVLRDVSYRGSNYGRNFFVECSGRPIRS